MKLSDVGVDLAKNVFQLHGVDRHGKTIWKRRLRSGQWQQDIVILLPTDNSKWMESRNLIRYFDYPT